MLKKIIISGVLLVSIPILSMDAPPAAAQAAPAQPAAPNNLLPAEADIAEKLKELREQRIAKRTQARNAQMCDALTKSINWQKEVSLADTLWAQKKAEPCDVWNKIAYFIGVLVPLKIAKINRLRLALSESKPTEPKLPLLEHCATEELERARKNVVPEKAYSSIDIVKLILTPKYEEINSLRVQLAHQFPPIRLEEIPADQMKLPKLQTLYHLHKIKKEQDQLIEASKKERDQHSAVILEMQQLRNQHEQLNQELAKQSAQKESAFTKIERIKNLIALGSSSSSTDGSAQTIQSLKDELGQ